MLGCSYEEGRDIFTLKELESLFRMEKLNKAPAVFDYKKLEWFNGQYMRLFSDEQLYSAVLPFILKEGIVTSGTNGEISGADREKLLKVMPLIKERLHFLSEAPAMVRFLFEEPETPAVSDIVPKKLDAAKTKEVLTAAKDFVKDISRQTDEEADAAARELAEKLGVKLGDLMMPVRMAVTGSRISPPLIGSIRILGTENALERIDKTLKVL